MRRKRRTVRALKVLMIVGASGTMPGFILRCDKAALNLQRTFYEGLGDNLADLVVEQVNLP